MRTKTFEIIYPVHQKDIVFYIMSALKHYIEESLCSNYELMETLYSCIYCMPGKYSIENNAKDTYDLEDALDNSSLNFPKYFKKLITELSIVSPNTEFIFKVKYSGRLDPYYDSMIRYIKNLLRETESTSFKITVEVEHELY